MCALRTQTTFVVDRKTIEVLLEDRFVFSWSAAILTPRAAWVTSSFRNAGGASLLGRPFR